jgi:hypothetical protein
MREAIYLIKDEGNEQVRLEPNPYGMEVERNKSVGDDSRPWSLDYITHNPEHPGHSYITTWCKAIEAYRSLLSEDKRGHQNPWRIYILESQTFLTKNFFTGPYAKFASAVANRGERS